MCGCEKAGAKYRYVIWRQHVYVARVRHWNLDVHAASNPQSYKKRTTNNNKDRHPSTYTVTKETVMQVRNVYAYQVKYRLAPTDRRSGKDSEWSPSCNLRLRQFIAQRPANYCCDAFRRPDAYGDRDTPFQLIRLQQAASALLAQSFSSLAEL